MVIFVQWDTVWKNVDTCNANQDTHVSSVHAYLISLNVIQTRTVKKDIIVLKIRNVQINVRKKTTVNRDKYVKKDNAKLKN